MGKINWNITKEQKMTTLIEKFGETLLSKDNKEVKTSEVLQNLDAIAIYFSAHWCPPCRGFTPVLSKKYEEIKSSGKKFEIIFASSDQGQESFEAYFKEMPWLALPFSNRDLKEKLANEYGCSGIPMLIIMDGKTLETITTNGRAGISSKTYIEDFPYHPKPVYDISESMDGIESNYSLLFVQEYADKAIQDTNNALMLKIEKQVNKKGEKDIKKFFTANGGGPLSFIRSQCKLDSHTATCGCELKPAEGTNFGCDGCGKGGAQLKGRHRCADCDFDLCDECLEKSKQPMPESIKAPVMLVLDVAKRQFYKPKPEFGEVNEANCLKLMEMFKNGE